MDQYIFTYINEDQGGIFRDLTSESAKEKIDFLLSHKRFKNPLFSNLEKVCLSYKLNSKFHVPLQTLFYNLDSYEYRVENTYHLIMPTTSISKISIKYLAGFKRRHPNVKLYAFVTDSMHASSPHMNLVRDKLFSSVWDKVLTYDRYDAAEYGFTWFGYTYYSSFDFVCPDHKKSDIYYVGYDKGGRNEILSKLYTDLVGSGVNCRFDVVSSNPSSKESPFEYLSRAITYPQVIARVKSTNCILEVLQENQQAQSLRYLEAVVYNKKLLTTNTRIEELPYYNDRYMRIINRSEDVDVDWLVKREEIDYGYKGEFSPLNILKHLNSF